MQALGSQITVGPSTPTALAAHTHSPDSRSICGEIWQLRGIRPVTLGKSLGKEAKMSADEEKIREVTILL